MNFILFHLGNEFPIHFKYCVKQIINTNPNANIHIITNLNIADDKGVHVINTTELDVPDIGAYYLNHSMGQLFRNSMYRLFYIESYMKKFNLTDIIHFDNDVLIYDNIDTISDQLKKFNFIMTSHSPEDYVFGFSYIKNTSSIKNVTDKLLPLIQMGEQELERRIGTMPHEMRLLCYINNNNEYIDILPSMPNDKYAEDFGFCFDPSTYGQILGGLHPNELQHHYIGKQIHEKNINIKFENHRPIVYNNNNKIKLFNLHVHNKRLEMFI